MKLFKSKYFLLYASLFFLLTTVCLNLLKTYNLAELSNKTSLKIAKKQVELKALAEQALTNPSLDFSELYSEKNIGVYVYQNNTLSYWNNSQIAIPISLNHEFDSSLVRLRNGYYLSHSANNGALTAVVLTLVKSKYDLQNDYLKNSFAPWLQLPEDVGFKAAKLEGSEVYSGNQFLFSLSGAETTYRSPATTKALTILFFASILCYLLFVIRETKLNSFSIPNVSQVIAVLLLRFLILYFKWPEFLYRGDLYNLGLFGNAESFFNYFLGDMVLNAILLLWLSVIFYYWLKNCTNDMARIIPIVLSVVLLFVVLTLHHHVFGSIVSNSQISFDFLNLFDLTWLTYIALIPVVLISLSVLIVLYTLYHFSFPAKKNAHIFYLGITFVVGVLLIYLLPSNYWLEKWWFIPFSLFVYVLCYLKLYKNIIGLGTILLLLALLSSAILNFYISKNEQQNFKHQSYELTERQDAVLESEFLNLSNKITKDQQLANLSQFVAFNGDKEFLQLLRQNFFFGYFDRYNIEFSMFDEDCTPLIKNTQPILLNEGFFEEQIRYQSVPTISQDLYFIDQYKQSTRYIARINLGKNKLYIVLEPKFFEEVGAFPDLLIDQSQKKENNYQNLSYAVYRSGINNSMFGEYNYPVYLNDSTKLLNRADNTYTHHFFYPEENATIIISTKSKNLSYYFTYNSYLFLLLSIVVYLGYLTYSLFFSAQLQTSSLTRRIQTTVILLLLVSITAVCITSTKLVSNQFDKDNEKQLQEKTNTILSELSSQLQNSNSISDVSKELIDLTIKKYAFVFNSEVSLFDSTGFLYLTSQPRLYELGLAAPLVNAEAFKNLKNDIVSIYCSKDKAGELNYLSLYTPIYNADKKLLGYLNLPYFGKQSVLINELSGIISTLINVYVILFIISILSGLILSGYITLPLRILKQQMAKVSLGTKNEAIKWDSNDEVGKLVSEYNEMIDKLDKSAGLLAKSEREIAWREMAKQVAHEIKNPLTPMKLNLQYLQHVIKNNPSDFEERFAKASNNIIEQIDALANIATEFSNFAKLPSGELENINLSEVIHSTVDLFEKENNLKISLNLHTTNIPILANKEQMLRVFNNLLKNAIQATDDVLQPHIQISSKEENGHYLVSVSDNGCGIPEASKPSIFTPNFTTKSTGSGLGLAMIKNIFETIGAKIWFESEENKGSVFYLQFKRTND